MKAASKEPPYPMYEVTVDFHGEQRAVQYTLIDCGDERIDSNWWFKCDGCGTDGHVCTNDLPLTFAESQNIWAAIAVDSGALLNTGR